MRILSPLCSPIVSIFLLNHPAICRRCRRGRARDEVEGRVRLLHPERDGREPLDRGLLLGPVECGRHERLDGAPRGGVEAVERWHDLAAREHLDPEPPAAHLLDDLRQPLGRALQMVECRGPGRGHSPLDLRLGDHVGSIGDAGSSHSRYRAACRREEPASVSDHAGSLSRTKTRSSGGGPTRDSDHRPEDAGGPGCVITAPRESVAIVGGRMRAAYRKVQGMSMKPSLPRECSCRGPGWSPRRSPR